MKKIGVLIAAVLVLGSCGKSSDDSTAPDSNQGPYQNFKTSDVHGEKNFATLVNNYLTGKPDRPSWAGYWWPYGENGIASGKYNSPAAKYDKARRNGGTITSAEDWETKNHGSKVPKLQGWWGHCNGWTAASGLYAEPNKSVTVNGVEFGIADIKALLSEAGMEVSADFYGQRVDWGNDYGTPKWFDTVPDQYLLVLTNFMGKQKMAVNIDRYTGDEIWNQPLEGYKIDYPKPEDYLGADPAHPGVYRINVTSAIWWGEDGVPPDVQTPAFDFQTNEVFSTRTLKMEVWLDGPVVFDASGKITSSGNVIVTRQGEDFYGGTWRMGDGYGVDQWPDYMWIPYSMIKPTDYANPYVDIKWIEAHIWPNQSDDPVVHPTPSPSSSSSPSPSHSPAPSFSPEPTHSHSPIPWPSFPFPWPTHTPVPTSTPTPGPSHS